MGGDTPANCSGSGAGEWQHIIAAENEEQERLTMYTYRSRTIQASGRSKPEPVNEAAKRDEAMIWRPPSQACHRCREAEKRSQKTSDQGDHVMPQGIVVGWWPQPRRPGGGPDNGNVVMGYHLRRGGVPRSNIPEERSGSCKLSDCKDEGSFGRVSVRIRHTARRGPLRDHAILQPGATDGSLVGSGPFPACTAPSASRRCRRSVSRGSGPSR